MSQATKPVLAHATGLDAGEEASFVHAVALAAASGARLVSVHANGGAAARERMPRAESLTSRWGTPIEHEQLVHDCCDDVTDTLLDALRRVGPDLVVAATHARKGIATLLSGSVAEALARNVGVPTLVLPIGGRGFVDEQTGALDLRRVLVPAGDATATRVGLAAAAFLAGLAGVERMKVVLLHVDDGTPVPEVGQVDPRLEITQVVERGSVEAAIARASRDHETCAIVMATRGHDGVMDVLTGSHTEHVLRDVACALLSVPITT
jgi:nucleotide-binding universal stress UspA family protein